MIKNYNQFLNESVSFPNTEEEIHNLCRKFRIYDYTINDDMSINVYGDVKNLLKMI